MREVYFLADRLMVSWGWYSNATVPEGLDDALLWLRVKKTARARIAPPTMTHADFFMVTKTRHAQGNIRRQIA